MEFTLKHYKKGASIQLKPTEDISTDKQRPVHFSIAWFKTKTISKSEKRLITAELFSALQQCVETMLVDSRLDFKIVNACENCTYGHFDDAFEQIVCDFREKYPQLCVEKNLPLEQHPELPQEREILFHIAHSRSSDEEFNNVLKKSGNILQLRVECVEVNK